MREGGMRAMMGAFRSRCWMDKWVLMSLRNDAEAK